LLNTHRCSQSVTSEASAIADDGTRELHRGNWLVGFQQRIHFCSRIGKFDRKPYAEIYVESTKLFFEYTADIPYPRYDFPEKGFDTPPIFPHWHAEFPENLHIVQGRKDLSEETKKQSSVRNAKSLYQI
jgi:hypothetical protein